MMFLLLPFKNDCTGIKGYANISGIVTPVRKGMRGEMVAAWIRRGK